MRKFRLKGWVEHDLDTLCERKEKKLNREIDSILADDRLWSHPNWKRRRLVQCLSGLLCGVLCALGVISLIHYLFY